MYDQRTLLAIYIPLGTVVPRSSYGNGPSKPRMDEDTLKRETLQIERKTFILTLKENPRGRFLRITEDVNGRRDNVIIPSTGLEEFSKIWPRWLKHPPKFRSSQLSHW